MNKIAINFIIIAILIKVVLIRPTPALAFFKIIFQMFISISRFFVFFLKRNLLLEIQCCDMARDGDMPVCGGVPLCGCMPLPNGVPLCGDVPLRGGAPFVNDAPFV